MPDNPDTAIYGLRPSVVDSMNAVFASYPQVERAILYGSRAKGNFKRGSDIDLCLVAPSLTMPLRLNLETALDDLLLPYKIDLSLRHHIDNAELLAHIERIGVDFYRRGGAVASNDFFT